MNNTLSTFISLPDVMLSSRPKVVVGDALVNLLKKRLKGLKIMWVPSNFRKALANPKLPAWLLTKLETLIAVAEASGWRISNALAFEIDETVEDIETFNPAYRAALKKEARDARRGIKLGKFISSEDVVTKLGTKR